MSAPQLPTIDRKTYGDTPDLLRYHDQLRPFLEGVSGSGARPVHRSEPIVFTVPDDWVPLATSNSWSANGAYIPPAYRVMDDGGVVVRGVLQRASTPAVGSQVLGALPEPDGVQPVLVFTDAGLGMADVSSSAGAGVLTYYAGGIVRFSLSAVRYTAKSRTPGGWRAPVVVGCPFQPALVALHAEEADAQGRPLGAGQLVLPAWKPISSGVSITRAPGLVPGGRYRLTMWALSG